MLRVALTGPIAAGKSTVVARLRELGALVIDADALAREVVAPGTPGAAEVAQVFGPDVIGADGAVDRAVLGGIVFADPAARARLEAIVHPRVRARRRELEEQAHAAGAAVVVNDIPLLVETGQQDRFDHVVVVEAPVELRLRRLVTGRGLDPVEAQRRIDAQATAAERAAVADVIWDGSGDVEELRAQVTAWWERLAAEPPRGGPDGARTPALPG